MVDVPINAGLHRRSLLAATGLVLASGGVGRGETRAVPGPVTDLIWHQGMPLHPQSQGDTIGYFEPVGGIGPFTYAFGAGVDGSKYAIQGPAVITPVTGGVGAGDTRLPVTVTDALGRSFTKSITVIKTGQTPYIWCSAASGVFTNVPSASVYGYITRIYGLAGAVSFSCNDGNFHWNGNDPYLHLNTIPAAGRYVLDVMATSASGTVRQSIAIPVRDVTISPIYFAPGGVSTSMVPGSHVGTACFTTTDNAGTVALTDNVGGTYAIHPATRKVTVLAPPKAGANRIGIRATDVTLVRDDTFTIDVAQGAVLPPENMTMVVSKTLKNWGRNQAAGTPRVVGITGTPRWSMVQNNVCDEMTASDYGGKVGNPGYRYTIDPASGVVIANGTLSAKTDQLTITCTDGINTCTRTFAVPVTAVVGPTWHIGEGMARLHGANGFEHIRDVYGLMDGSHPGFRAIIYSNKNPDYFANDGGAFDASIRDPYQGNWRHGINGGGAFIGAQGSGGKRPRLGGAVGSAQGGYDWNGEGILNLNHGDFVVENIEFGWAHGTYDINSGGRMAGVSCIRKNADTYGDLTVRNCLFHDHDNGIETGAATGDYAVHDSVFQNGGCEYVGTGATHNMYFGQNPSVRIENVLTSMVTNGHGIKSRSQRTTIINTRVLDGERGESSCCIDLPDGGLVVIDGCTLQKGPNPQNPNLLQFCAEGASCQEHRMLVTNTTFINAAPHYMRTTAGPGPRAVLHAGIRTKEGGYSTVTLGAGNRYYGFLPEARLIGQFNGGWIGASAGPDDGHSYTPAETAAPVMLNAMPALDWGFAGTGEVPRRPGPYSFTIDNARGFDNWDTGQMDFGSDDIRVPHDAPPGTVVAAVAVTGIPLAAHSSRQPDARINPFGPGTTFSLPRPRTFGGAVPWAPEGQYLIDAGGRITLGTAPSKPGTLEWLTVRATAPNGSVCDRRCYIYRI